MPQRSPPPLSPEFVLDALKRIQDPDGDPDGQGDIVHMGKVSGVDVVGGEVTFAITVNPAHGPALETMRLAAEQAVRALPGVTSVRAILTAEREGPPPPPPKPRPPHAAPSRIDVSGIGAIIAVASGKGGVGKSTTAVNLALALVAEGRKVGLLDADIYGPSLPRLVGVSGKPDTADGRVLIPPERYGLKLMSMGFLVAEEAPIVWRGPMVMSAVQQMLRDVAWAPLDVLIIDMPPGTGDAHLTLAQSVPLAGAVIVSTPQDIALIDARKGLAMFQKVGVPVLGIIENMSYFHCPHCGTRSEIFAHGGARREAERLGVPFLGEVPLDIALRTSSDKGEPIMVADRSGPLAAIYRNMARRLLP